MRLFILMLSMACVTLYGYALAGYVGYAFGRGRPDYILWGLSLGTLCGATALYLWKKWMPLFLMDTEEEKESHDDTDGGHTDL